MRGFLLNSAHLQKSLFLLLYLPNTSAFTVVHFFLSCSRTVEQKKEGGVMRTTYTAIIFIIGVLFSIHASAADHNGLLGNKKKKKLSREAVIDSTHSKLFIDRYNSIKAAYPQLEVLFGDYAKAVTPLDSFMTRYYIIRDTYPDLAKYHGDFAASSQPLDKFIERFYGIKASYPFLQDYYGEYAGANISIEDFTARFYAVKHSFPRMKDAYGEYAAGNQDLKTFMRRYKWIKSQQPGMGKELSTYAAMSTKK
jgi:hypothetical protein